MTAVSASEQGVLESACHQMDSQWAHWLTSLDRTDIVVGCVRKKKGEKGGRRRSDCQLDALYLIGLIVKTPLSNLSLGPKWLGQLNNKCCIYIEDSCLPLFIFRFHWVSRKDCHFLLFFYLLIILHHRAIDVTRTHPRVKFCRLSFFTHLPMPTNQSVKGQRASRPKARTGCITCK